MGIRIRRLLPVDCPCDLVPQQIRFRKKRFVGDAFGMNRDLAFCRPQAGISDDRGRESNKQPEDGAQLLLI